MVVINMLKRSKIRLKTCVLISKKHLDFKVSLTVKLLFLSTRSLFL